ncbi:MAG: glycosyltransferase, group 2 family [Caulobacteraceae bacterium]|nr:glycosyltransferase, group 2 family [Caulobacteraceae bacterium]
MTAPEISCVIPTHERADLAARCLTSVAAQREAGVEIIVTDDSRSSTIRDLVAALAPFTPGVQFLEGPRTGNPVDNWNAGLERARAPLRVLIHQDEFLVDPLYLRRAIDALDRTGAAATLAGVNVIGVARPSRFSLVAPIAGRLPGARRLLPLVNWIGPTAAFVFRAGPRFDPALMQLADVEFYGRVLLTGRLVRLPGVGVGSLGHHDGQITARIDPVREALKELALLASRRPAAISRVEHAAFSAALRLRRRFA